MRVLSATRRRPGIPFDLVIEIKNEPGALARVAAAVSDAGVNLAAATCLGATDDVELHILVLIPRLPDMPWRSRSSLSAGSGKSSSSTSKTGRACSPT